LDVLETNHINDGYIWTNFGFNSDRGGGWLGAYRGKNVTVSFKPIESYPDISRISVYLNGAELCGMDGAHLYNCSYFLPGAADIFLELRVYASPSVLNLWHSNQSWPVYEVALMHYDDSACTDRTGSTISLWGYGGNQGNQFAAILYDDWITTATHWWDCSNPSIDNAVVNFNRVVPSGGYDPSVSYCSVIDSGLNDQLALESMLSDFVSVDFQLASCSQIVPPFAVTDLLTIVPDWVISGLPDPIELVINVAQWPGMNVCFIPVSIGDLNLFGLSFSVLPLGTAALAGFVLKHFISK
jgi:hypothetical protein